MECGKRLVTSPRTGYGIAGEEFLNSPTISVEVAEETVWALVVTTSS